MIGDDIFITEEAYLNKIGNLVINIDILLKRMAAKDAAISDLTNKVKELETQVAQLMAPQTKGKA